MIRQENLEYIDEMVGEIPVWVIRPKKKTEDEKFKTIIFYHGWSSCRDNQIFRAGIFASYGYQVIIPEARFHGKRGTLDYFDMNVVRDYFLRVLMHNIEESVEIYKAAIDKFDADKDFIILSGHSLGAITAGSIYTYNRNVKAALLFNGTMNWQKLVEELKKVEKETDWKSDRRYEFALQMDPMIHTEDFLDRDLFMLHGEEDKTVNPDFDEIFYNETKDKFKAKIIFEKFEKTTHQITTQMLERAIGLLEEL